MTKKKPEGVYYLVPPPKKKKVLNYYMYCEENGSMKPPAKNSTGVTDIVQKKENRFPPLNQHLHLYQGFGSGGFLFLIKK